MPVFMARHILLVADQITRGHLENFGLRRL